MSGYRKDKTGTAQTSANVASAQVVAALTSGAFKPESDPGDAEGLATEILDLFRRLEQPVFNVLEAVVDQDNALFEKLEKEENAKGASSSSRTSSSGGSGGGGGSSRKSGGSKSGGKNSTSPSEAAAQAGDYKLTFGAFKGETIAHIHGLSASEADEYGYGKSGKEYVEGYLMDDRQKNSEYAGVKNAHAAAAAFLEDN